MFPTESPPDPYRVWGNLLAGRCIIERPTVASSTLFKSLLVFLASLAVYSIGIYTWWKEVQSHPIAGGLLSVAYWLIAAAGVFIAKVWKELERRWVKSAADWIEGEIRIVISRFRRHYYKQLGFRHRVFNVRGLRTQGTYTLELEKVFVELRTAPCNPGDAQANPLRGDVQPGNCSIWEVLVSEHEAYRCLAVIGPPGCGKTTLLQHLALTFAGNKQRRYDRRCRAYVPVLLFLREHVRSISSDNPPTLAELATAYEEKEKTNPPKEWFNRKLTRRKCLVLLDGLDEVANADDRRKVAQWVDKQVEVFGGNRFIVTSRPHGYRSNPLREASVREVQPFTMEQITKFIRNWCVANEILSFGCKDDPGVRKAAEN